MPYIDKATRYLLDKELLNLYSTITEPGDLNYVFTHLIHKYIKWTRRDYCQLSAMIGTLECAKLELYRKIVAPYEDQKEVENGKIGILD